MRAARIVAPRSIALEEVPIPEPGSDQVRVRVEGCGVCGSNLGPWLGQEGIRYPLAPGEGGHEAWGTIDSIGASVRNVRVGDKVSMVSYRAFAEHDLAEARAVVPIPDALADRPFPGESFGCAMNVVRRSAITAGDTVAVVGVGALGALVVRLASRAGARVIAISRRESSLALAREMGAADTIAMHDHHEIVKKVNRLTGGEGCECVIEAVGKQWPLDLAADLTRCRGKLVIAGYHQDGPRQVNMQLWNWRGLDVINAHERELRRYVEGIQGATDAIASLGIDTRKICTHPYPLESLSEALDAMVSKPEGFVKAVVAP